MNTGNALGFLFFAAAMKLLPAFAPGWFPPTGLDGSNARALWLEVMALVQAGCGASFLFSRWVVPTMTRIAAHLPQRKAPEGAMLPVSSQVRAG
jgi:hypothetical protein